MPSTAVAQGATVLQALTTVPEPASSTPAPAVPHLPAAAQGQAATPARPWEASTLRLNKGDVTVFQTLSPAVARQPACLILYSGEDAGKRFPLENLVLTIGRSPECPVWVDHPGISRCHAELLRDADGYILRDLASSNGTHLNGQRCQKLGWGLATIKDFWEWRMPINPANPVIQRLLNGHLQGASVVRLDAVSHKPPRQSPLCNMAPH